MSSIQESGQKDQSKKNMLPPHGESSGARRAKKREKSKKGLAFCLPAGGIKKGAVPQKKGRPPTKRKQKGHQKKQSPPPP